MLLVLLVVLLIAILLDLSCFLLLLAILSVERWRCVHGLCARVLVIEREGGREGESIYIYIYIYIYI